MRRVRLAKTADRDLSRLAEWLGPKSPIAADLAADALTEAIESLAEFPDRGRPLHRGLRELSVKFGRYGYAIRYRVTPDEVFVSRIFHTRERR